MVRGLNRRNVFINCPFDGRYTPLFRAIVFVVYDCGFIPRCALELEDSSRVRIDKILNLISACRFGIHDISRTSLDATTHLPRFNMPFELGLFLGAERFGGSGVEPEYCLILDRHRYRYQKFLSDISGQDIVGHGNKADRVIAAVRNWLRSSSGQMLPGGADISRRYRRFRMELPKLCRGFGHLCVKITCSKSWS